MDSELDFLRADLLYQLVIRDRSVIIEPFVLLSKLSALRSILECFYTLQEFDPQMLTSSESIRLFCDGITQMNQSQDNSQKKTWIIINNLTESILTELKAYPEIHFVGVKQEISPNPPDFSEYVIFNKKSGELLHVIMDDPELGEWCEGVMQKITDPGLNATVEYLQDIFAASTQLFEICGAFTVKDYVILMQSYSPRERKVIHCLCENRFQINLGEIFPEEGIFSDIFEAQKDSLSEVAVHDTELDQQFSTPPADDVPELNVLTHLSLSDLYKIKLENIRTRYLNTEDRTFFFKNYIIEMKRRILVECKNQK